MAPSPDNPPANLWQQMRQQCLRHLKGYCLHPAVLMSTLIAFAILGSAWYFLDSRRDEQIRASFEGQTQAIGTKVEERLAAYDTVLRGAAARFAGNPVSRQDWQHYVRVLGLEKAYPGIHGLGFATYLTPNTLRDHISKIRSTGISHYDIRPEGTRPQYATVTYFESFFHENKLSYGYDLLTEPVRREALLRSLRTGQIAYSGRLLLFHEQNPEKKVGILAAFPVGWHPSPHGETDQNTALGWVYAPLTLSKLFNDIRGTGQSGIRLEVFDGKEQDLDQLLYDSHPATPSTANSPSIVRQHPFGGRVWTIRYTSVSDIDGVHQLELWTARAALLTIALLILGISTEFIKAQELARNAVESDLRFRTLADSGSALVWASDTEGKCNYLNGRWLEFTGRSREDGLGDGWLVSVHPDDLGPCQTAFSQAFSTQSPFSLTYRLRRRDGIFRWFLDEGSARYDSQGQFAGYIGHCLDITEYKRVNDELRASESRYAMLAKVSLVGIYHADAAGRFLYVNERWCALAGVAAETAKGDGWMDVIHPDDLATVQREWQKTISEKHHSELEYRLQRPDGSVLWVFGQVACMQDEEGAITGLVGTITDISQLKEAEAKILSLAFYDTLTDLPNRRLLMDRLAQAVAVSRRNGQFGALLFIDLDNFKTLNDTQGHDVGDRLLVEVGNRLRHAIRAGDTVARLGGDEFVVMLEDLGDTPADAATQAENVAEKIQITLKKPYALRPSSQADYYNTPSIGVSLFQGEETSVDNLLKQADMALYQAKGAGRNTIRFFNPEMQATLEARTALEIGLRQALHEQEFSLHYQPQIDRSRRIIGAEALLRWQPAHGTMIPVAGFIPVAEETGLILPIGQWVLETACAQLKAWEKDPWLSQLTLSINISPRQFRQHDFVEQVLATLKRFGANPSLLKIELTESVVLDDVDDTIHKMRELRRMGIGFSLDDFGTGYSSLSYLKRLPLNQLKIDRSFVQDIETDDNDAAICAAIIALALNLGLQVVAEGVETNAQHYFLAVEHHCNLLQGYLFGKPMPINDLEALVHRQFRKA